MSAAVHPAAGVRWTPARWRALEVLARQKDGIGRRSNTTDEVEGFAWIQSKVASWLVAQGLAIPLMYGVGGRAIRITDEGRAELTRVAGS